MAAPRRCRVLLGVTGSVAAVKYPELTLRLLEFCDVKVVLTKGAELMRAATMAYNPAAWARLEAEAQRGVTVTHVDADEWSGYVDVGRDAVLHIDVSVCQARRCVVTAFSCRLCAAFALDSSGRGLISFS